MIVKKLFVKLAAAAVLFVPVAAAAQTSSINAFSPYSMYGIGELQTPGVVAMRSMGGVGIGLRSTMVVNTLNPAAYSMTPRQGFLFDFGVEGANFYNEQRQGSRLASTAYNTFNFHDIAFQLPVAKRLGFGFSLTPYSSVGYRVDDDDRSEDIWGDIGRVSYTYAGEGDISEVKFGFGWEPVKRLSIGVAALYYWGDIDRSYATQVVNNIIDGGTVNSVIGTDNYTVSRMKVQFGLQADLIRNMERILTFGATYDLGGDLKPDVTRGVRTGDLIGSVVRGDTTVLELKLPTQLAAGLTYQTAKLNIGLDYVYQNWGSRNHRTDESDVPGALIVDYRNTNTVKFGVEYTPNRGDVRHYLKRWSYRAGFRYGSYYQTFQGKDISQYAVTCGIGLPLKFLGRSSIDVGFEYGQRGDTSGITVDNRRLGLVRQRYWKISLGMTLFGEDSWFTRYKFD